MIDAIQTTIDAAGRLVVPKAIRDRAGLKAGIPLQIALVGDHVEIRPAPRALRLESKNGVIVAQPAEPSETLREEVVSVVRDELRTRSE